MIEVLKPGFYTSIQDCGRRGYAHLGVPVSGTMDDYSAQLANHLVRNHKTAALLEITMGNCRLRFQKAAQICLCGADFRPQINKHDIRLNKPFWAEKNDILSFRGRCYGVRTYLAVAGGIRSDLKLGSRSFCKYLNKQAALSKGMILPLCTHAQKKTENSFSAVKINNKHFESEEIHCHQGPEFHGLSASQQAQLRQTTFSISPENNRMGYRLNENIRHKLPAILTSAVLPGTVQLTPSGKMIILMKDCQVTGGYPRILQLTPKAVGRLAQKTTGDKIFFTILPH